MDESRWGVHMTHCCVIHGCKYSDEDCPVETGEVMQTLPCSFCPDDEGNVSWDKLIVASAAKRGLLFNEVDISMDTVAIHNVLAVMGDPAVVYELRYPDLEYVNAFDRLYEAVQVAIKEDCDVMYVDREDVTKVLFN